MNTTLQRADQLEGRFERLLVDFGNLQQQVAALIGQIQGLQGGNSQPQGQGGGLFYAIAPTPITAAANSPAASAALAASGNPITATVYAVVGGIWTALPGTYSVYNPMHSATVATGGLTIVVGANPDGTFSVITQSC